MTRYSVRCGLAGIYAGILKNANEWKNKTPVTDEAIEAVRDWLFQNMPKDQNVNGYAWMLKDGREVQLIVKVIEQKQEKKEEKDE